ncbi:MAG TPA: hypothetical protein VH475_29115, partial [Tepidisphaeraceae bacterium]
GFFAAVELTVDGLPAGQTTARVRTFVVDEERSNAFTAWKKMDSPRQPTAEQYRRLEEAGKLWGGPEETVAVKEGKVTLPFDLARRGVELVVVERQK